MRFDTFKKCLDKIPSYIRIDFSGMAEPWINPECTKMVLYARKRGFKIAVYTTLIGMTLADIELIKDILFEEFVVHLPDEEGYARIMINENYLAILKKLSKSNISNLSYMSMGTVPEIVQEIIQTDIPRSGMQSRAGNVENAKGIWAVNGRKHGKIRCIISMGNCLNHNVLLPNGDVILCCMDYGLKHKLGNLLSSNYSSLFMGEEFHKLQKGLNDDSLDILCRHCVWAKSKRNFFILSNIRKFNKLLKNLIRNSKKLF